MPGILSFRIVQRPQDKLPRKSVGQLPATCNRGETENEWSSLDVEKTRFRDHFGL